MDRTSVQRRRRREEGRGHGAVTDAAPAGLTLASVREDDRRPGTALFQQQCWLWGRDVRRAEGNLLIEYGFTRTSVPKEEWGSSCYTYELSSSCSLRLWGFGVLLCDQRHGALFLQRAMFEPRLIASDDIPESIWRPEQLAKSRMPVLPADTEALLQLLPPLLAWIGAYEQWVLDTFGTSYRLRALEGWEQPHVVPESVPSHWWSMAAAWREQLSA